MRIAIVNQFGHIAGGTEVYLSNLLPELRRRGFETGFWHELDVPGNREQPISSSEETAVYSVQDLGLAAARQALVNWKPDLIYSQGVASAEWDSCLYSIAPVVQFIHTYHGTCISGNKAWKFPQARPCDRRFGWSCLAHYYPHRCGGLSPITMIEDFATQSQRLKALGRCAFLLTASNHMRREYLQHGFEADRIFVAGLYVPPRSGRNVMPSGLKEIRILFSGRMGWLKGGRLLLDALPIVAQKTNRRIKMTLVGGGPERAEWESHAAFLSSSHPQLSFSFLKWSSQQECEALYEQHHLLAVPSVWPEPFGLTGPEASQFGLPAVAFAVGGISDWLEDGVNGHLASADPPTASGLAEAIGKCVSDPVHYEKLRQAALRTAGRFSLERHFQTLLPVFESAVKSGAPYTI
jgi:glycosyltransferase involved in cell wall biosynthesis